MDCVGDIEGSVEVDGRNDATVVVGKGDVLGFPDGDIVVGVCNFRLSILCLLCDVAYKKWRIYIMGRCM